MELQGKKLKFGFLGADRFDKYAKEEGHRSLNGILYAVMNENKRLEDKYGKSFDKLTKKQQSEHVFDVGAGEIISIFSAFSGVDRQPACDLLDKELESGKVLPEIMAVLFGELFSSPLYTAIKVKDANPTQPK